MQNTWLARIKSLPALLSRSRAESDTDTASADADGALEASAPVSSEGTSAQVEDFMRPRTQSPVPFTRLADWLPYSAFDGQRDLFYVAAVDADSVESIGFCLEFQPQIGASPEMAEFLGGLFTSGAPVDTGITIHLFGSPDIRSFLQAYEDITLKPQNFTPGTPKHLQVTMLHALMRKRSEYFSKGATQGLFRDMNFRLRDFRGVVSVCVPAPRKAGGGFMLLRDLLRMPDLEEFLRRVELMRETMSSILDSYYLRPRRWKAQDLMDWNGLLLNMPQFLGGGSTHSVYDPGRPLRAQMVSHETDFEETEDDLRIRCRGLEPMHVRALSVRSYPRSTSLHQMRDLLGSATNASLAYPCPFLITLGVKILEFDSEKNRTTLKAARATQNADSPMARFQPDLQTRREDWNIALESFGDGKGLVKMYHQLLLFSSSADLEKAEQSARAIWRGAGFDLIVDRKMQKQALLASLPLMYGQLLQQDLQIALRSSKKTVDNATNMMPILGEHPGNGTPVIPLFGRQSGQAMGIDIFANTSGNFNSIIVGASGSGKSFFLNELVTRLVATGGKAWILDIGRSYEKLCRLLGGQYLEFSPQSNICLNPFSMIQDLDEEMQLVRPMIAQMISPSRALDDYEATQLEICIRQLWEEVGPNSTLTMLADRLKQLRVEGRQEGDNGFDGRIFDLGVQLFPFTREGQYGRYFDGPANVRFDSDLVVLELEELNSMKDLQAVVMLVILYKINQEMYTGNRAQRKLCVIDEAWSLMGGGQSGEFIETGFRRARKYNSAFATGTQSLLDYYSSPTAKAALDNADWMFLLRQKPESVEQLAQSGKLVLDEYTKKQLMSVTTRQGYFSEVWMRCGDMAPTVGRLFVDPYAQLVGSSKAQDYEAVRAYEGAGLSTVQAVEQVLADRSRAEGAAS
jgi:conjugal transfer ATP-binding protein TraC